MELKRYVMLNKIILNVRIIFETNENYVSFACEGERWYKRAIYFGDEYKTSDNILDLVEVGDLVATLYDGTIFEVGTIEEDVLYQKKHELKAYFNDVRAIYKRQPNGDYKRYEIKS